MSFEKLVEQIHLLEDKAFEAELEFLSKMQTEKVDWFSYSSVKAHFERKSISKKLETLILEARQLRMFSQVVKKNIIYLEKSIQQLEKELELSAKYIQSLRNSRVNRNERSVTVTS